MELAQKFIKGNCEIEPLYWEYLSFLNGEKLATAHILDQNMKPADLATPHFLVSYTVNEEEGREYTCVVRYPVRITSPIMAIPAGAYVEKKLKKYFGDKASITHKWITSMTWYQALRSSYKALHGNQRCAPDNLFGAYL